MTNMSIQPLWLTHFIEILLVPKFQITKFIVGAFSYKAHFRSQISSTEELNQKIQNLTQENERLSKKIEYLEAEQQRTKRQSHALEGIALLAEPAKNL